MRETKINGNKIDDLGGRGENQRKQKLNQAKFEGSKVPGKEIFNIQINKMLKFFSFTITKSSLNCSQDDNFMDFAAINRGGG